MLSAKPRCYLALWFPFLPTDRAWRSGRSPEPGETAFALVEKVKGALRLAAVDQRGRALGLVPGLTLADARARVPTLAVADIDPAADHVLLEQIADFCDRYTPLVALAGADGIVLDITGCAHLFGGEGGLHDDMLHRMARLRIEAQAAIAGTPEAAAAIARFGGGGIVMPGEEEAVVMRLPVAALEVAADIVQALSRAGLKTIGDLATRPRVPLAARFGEGLIARLRRTLGQVDVGISPRRPLPLCMIERAFAEPISRDDDVLETLMSLAGEAGRLLERRGEGGRMFEASFFRSDGKIRRLTVETGRPLRDPAALIRLFRERLDVLDDQLDAGFGFDFIRLTVAVSEAFAATQTSLDGHAVEEAEEAALLDRLSVRFGKERVLRFEPVDTHIPEEMVRAVPAARRETNGAEWPLPDPGMPPARPIHLFHPPQPIETVAEIPDGPPARFRWRRVQHEIVCAEGPERIAPEWWRSAGPSQTSPLTRDYYRVEDTAGHRFWVFREGLFERETIAPRWYLHGVFA